MHAKINSNVIYQSNKNKVNTAIEHKVTEMRE